MSLFQYILADANLVIDFSNGITIAAIVVIVAIVSLCCIACGVYVCYKRNKPAKVDVEMNPTQKVLTSVLMKQANYSNNPIPQQDEEDPPAPPPDHQEQEEQPPPPDDPVSTLFGYHDR